jgi:hypothetical protein
MAALDQSAARSRGLSRGKASDRASVMTGTFVHVTCGSREDKGIDQTPQA